MVTVTKEQLFYEGLTSGEFDSSLTQLGEAVLARFKIIQRNNIEQSRSVLKNGMKAVIKAAGSWKYNGTIVKVDRVFKNFAECTILVSDTLAVGDVIRFQLDLLVPVTHVNRNKKSELSAPLKKVRQLKRFGK